MFTCGDALTRSITGVIRNLTCEKQNSYAEFWNKIILKSSVKIKSYLCFTSFSDPSMGLFLLDFEPIKMGFRKAFDLNLAFVLIYLVNNDCIFFSIFPSILK